MTHFAAFGCGWCLAFSVAFATEGEKKLALCCLIAAAANVGIILVNI